MNCPHRGEGRELSCLDVRMCSIAEAVSCVIHLNCVVIFSLCWYGERCACCLEHGIAMCQRWIIVLSKMKPPLKIKAHGYRAKRNFSYFFLDRMTQKKYVPRSLYVCMSASFSLLKFVLWSIFPEFFLLFCLNFFVIEACFLTPSHVVFPVGCARSKNEIDQSSFNGSAPGSGQVRMEFLDWLVILSAIGWLAVYYRHPFLIG